MADMVGWSGTVGYMTLAAIDSGVAFPPTAKRVCLRAGYVLSALMQTLAQAEVLAVAVDGGIAPTVVQIPTLTLGHLYETMRAKPQSHARSAYFAAYAQARWLPENLDTCRKSDTLFDARTVDPVSAQGGITLPAEGTAWAAAQAISWWLRHRPDGYVTVRADSLRALAAAEAAGRMVAASGIGGPLSPEMVDVMNRAGGPLEALSYITRPVVGIGTTVVQAGASALVSYLSK